MLDKIYTILSNDGTVPGLATNGIWIEEAGQGKVPPYIIVSLEEGQPNNTKTGVSELDEIIISVFGYGDVVHTKGAVTGSFDLVKACRDALDHYDATVGGAKLYITANGVPQNFVDGTTNKPMKVTEQEFEVYLDPGDL